MRNVLPIPVLALTLLAAAAMADDKHHPPAGSAAPAADTAPAAAKGPPGMMPGGMMMRGGMMQGGMMQGGMGMHGTDKAAVLLAPSRIEGRLAYLKAEIAPAAAQEAEFADLAAALRAAERGSHGGPDHQHGASAPAAKDANAPAGGLAERLADSEKAATMRLQWLQAVRSAYAKLDAKLNPDQRKAAGELLPVLFPSAL